MSDSASTRGDRPSGKILIADCGSTKVRWVLLDTCGKILLLDFETTGFNAAVTSPEEIRRILRNEVAPKLQSADIDTLHFYGAGCIGGDVNWRLMDMLAEYIPAYWIEVASDLVAAARLRWDISSETKVRAPSWVGGLSETCSRVCCRRKS